MDYNSAIKYVNDCHKLGSKKGHENLKQLLELFDNPQEKLKIIHVAGTNGKGSLCTMLDYILREHGFKTALFTSPHLQKYNERFIINSRCISDDKFADIINRIKVNVNKLFKNNDEFFSFFEIITVAAFVYFYENNVDFAIIETGLGGRLDATNVIERPILSVITSISYDHMEYLGNTLEQIAVEKGGIIKKNCPVVLYSQCEAVYNIIKGISDEKNAELFYISDYNVKVLKESLNETIFSVSNNLICYDKVKIKMIGDYQIYNACNTLVCCEALKKYGVNETSVINGISKAYFNGRMEIISYNPFIMVDGAHNIDGALQFKRFLQKFKMTHKNIILLIGILKDKEYNQMIKDITEFADTVIITEPDNIRALNCLELAKVISKDKNVLIEPNYKKAFDIAYQNYKGTFLFCTGSLYLIGDIKNYMEEKFND